MPRGTDSLTSAQGTCPLFLPAEPSWPRPGTHAKEGIEQSLSRILSCNVDLGGQNAQATLRAIWGYLPRPHPPREQAQSGPESMTHEAINCFLSPSSLLLRQCCTFEETLTTQGVPNPPQFRKRGTVALPLKGGVCKELLGRCVSLQGVGESPHLCRNGYLPG